MVNVPERLSGKSFNFSKIARLFHADCKIRGHICFLINSASLETSFRIAALHGGNVSPGNCFMSREDFRKNITLKDRPKDFHLLRHQTMNQVLPEYCLVFYQASCKKYMMIFYHEMRFYTLFCIKISVINITRITMASTKECLDFVLEQLSLLDDISYKSMMGEYILMPCLMNCIRD